MKYHFNLFRSNQLLYEIFIGEFSTQDVVDNHLKMWGLAEKNAKRIDCIVDISNASFDSVEFSDIRKIHESVNTLFPPHTQIRFAIIHGQNQASDFLKVSALTKYYEAKGNISKNFDSLKQAILWLELTTQESELIQKEFDQIKTNTAVQLQ